MSQKITAGCLCWYKPNGIQAVAEEFLGQPEPIYDLEPNGFRRISFKGERYWRLDRPVEKRWAAEGHPEIDFIVEERNLMRLDGYDGEKETDRERTKELV